MPDQTFLHQLQVEGLSAETRVLHFEAVEGMSQLFHLDAIISSPEPIAFADVVGKPASFSMRPDADGDPRYVHGIVSRFVQLEVAKNYILYRATIVPKSWKLQHRLDSRIFQDLAVPDIIKKVLEGAGLTSGQDFKLSLLATYPTREYCVQYRESDWDFVCRLMEEEGIAFYFEQDDSKHLLVLIDAASSYVPIDGEATLTFRPPEGALGGVSHGTHVSRFVYAEEVRPGKFTLRDYDFKKPALSLEATKAGSANTDLEQYDYPGEYALKGDGDAIAAKRFDEAAVAAKTAEGDSTCVRLLAGRTFTLAEHATEALNASYVVLRVEHRGTEPDAVAEEADGQRQTPYANVFEAIPATVLFRPPRITRRPMIHGVQTAIVVGPSGEEIYTDEHGRVKVQFHWDRLGKKDDKSSCWMRVSQPWASAAYGAMFLPRINDEVVVTFLEGDPDRPLIVGRVYHGTNVPPYALPGEKTKSTIKSNTSPGGGGFNELRFEDKKGSEEVYLHGQKDWTIKIEHSKNQVVLHDETHSIGHDASLDVGHDRTHHVKHDETRNLDHDETHTTKHNRTDTVSHDETRTVSHNRTLSVGHDLAEDVSAHHTQHVGKSQKITVDAGREVKVGGNDHLTVSKNRVHKVTGGEFVVVDEDNSIHVKGKRTEKVDKDEALTVGGKMTVKVTGALDQETNDAYTMKAASKVEITCGSAKVTISSDGKIAIAGNQIEINGQAPVKINGATIDIAGQGPANLKGAMANVEAQGPAKLKGAIVQVDGSMVTIG